MAPHGGAGDCQAGRSAGYSGKVRGRKTQKRQHGLAHEAVNH